VLNNGEATLQITAAMISGAPVWQLLDSQPATVAGHATQDFTITFSPTDVGVAPAGQLTLTTNDNQNLMKVITLTGSGVVRNVAFVPTNNQDPTTIDLGTTGLGIPINAGDLLQVINRDNTNEFTIHAIKLDGASSFRLDNSPSDAALPATTKRGFAVTFDPREAGDFETTATLYLDQDPTAQATIKLKGHAVFVEAHGSGGCNAGGAGRSGGGVTLGLLALGVLRRRRRAGLASATRDAASRTVAS